MRIELFFQRPYAWQKICVALSLLLAVIIGGAQIFWNNIYAPIAVATGIFGIFAAALFLLRPNWALYLTIFIGLLPPADSGGPSAYVSLLIDALLAITIIGYVLQLGFEGRKIRAISIIAMVALFFCWLCVSALWATDLLVSRRELIQYSIFFSLMILSVNIINTIQDIDNFMAVVALCGWILVISGVITVAFFGYQYGDRLKVLGMNENSYGIELLITLPGVLWTAKRSSRRWKVLLTLVSVLFILLSILLIALSGSRGSIISIIASLMLFFFWKETRFWASIGIIVGLLAVLTAPFVFSDISARFTASDAEEGGSLGGRTVLWESSLALIQNHPWGGMGVGNGPYELIKYVNTRTNAFAHRDSIPSHNPFLETAIDSGIPGLLLFCSILFGSLLLYFRQYYRLWRRVSINATERYALNSYFAIMTCVGVGYLLSWIKSGGIKTNITYMLFLVFLLIPVYLSVFRSKKHASSVLAEVDE